MGLFTRRQKASVLFDAAVKADAAAEKAIVSAQESRATAAQRRIEGARAEAEEAAVRLEREAVEQDLRLAMGEQVKSQAVLNLSMKNVERAKRALAACKVKFDSIVGDTGVEVSEKDNKTQDVNEEKEA